MTMQVSVSGKQMDVGDALRTHIEDSVGTQVGKYFGSGIEAHAVLSREAHLYRCDLSVHIGRGIQMQATEHGADPYAATDSAVGHIAKRMRRHKRRLRDHHQQNGVQLKAQQGVEAQYSILSAETEADDDTDLPASDGAADGQPTVIAEMTTEIRTLSVGEAVMHMDLADEAAVMFRNSRHGGLNLVYRRKDGHIGWIDPGMAPGDRAR